MNLTAFAIRVVLRKLLLGQTYAGNRVDDSPTNPVAQLLSAASSHPDEPQAPGISLHTSKSVTKPQSRELQVVPHEIDVIIYSYLPPTFTIAAPTADGAQVMLEVQNAASSTALDFVARQIERAMSFGPEPWLGLWQKFIVRVEDVQSRGVLVQPEDGIQIPCHEATYTFRTVGEPEFGRAMFGAWAGLHAAMVADEELAPFAETLKQLIEKPDDLPDWRVIQGMLGASPAAIRAAGVAPADPTETGEPATISIEDEDEGTIDGIDVVVDTAPIYPDQGDEP